MESTASKVMTGPVEYFRAQLEYEITPGVLDKLLGEPTNNVCVVDVRDAAQFDAGHIPGARNVPLDSLPSSFYTLPKDKMIVPYCTDLACGMSAQAALELAQKGFRVQRLIGGIAEWSRRGFTLEASESSGASQAW
jgi:rhodanese-related sulfurtransferase